MGDIKEFNTKSILQSVKNGLMIIDTYDAFDPRIVGYINAVLSILAQIGYPNAENFEITGYDETWDDLITEPGFNMVKSFVIEQVALLFDPPSSSFALEAKQKYIEELEHRIRYKVETGG